MLRITIVTIGSRGDVQPYLALGLELQRAGHQVLINTHTNFENFITGHGLDFAPLAGDPVRLVELCMGSNGEPLQFMKIYYEFMDAILEQVMDEAYRACQGADVVLYPILALGAYHLVEKLKVPAFRLNIWPYDRTRSYASFMWPFGDALPGFSHVVNDYAQHLVFLRRFNRYRRQRLGLDSIPPIPYPYRQLNGRPLPMLYAFSEHVVPRPPDWGSDIHITGYWFVDEHENWQPPAALADFLNDGPPPVYIGFGSMAHEDFERISAMLLEALRQSGQRGLLLTGWGGLGQGDLPDTVYKIDSAPHDWLFPRMAGVVHHGGAGTTAAGLRAGKPTLVVPFFGDQPFWGRRVAALGVGPAPIPRTRMTVDNLAAGLRMIAADPGTRDRAAALGAKIRAENGVATARRIIEQAVC